MSEGDGGQCKEVCVPRVPVSVRQGAAVCSPWGVADCTIQKQALITVKFRTMF